MNQNGINPILDLVPIKCTQTQRLANESFDFLFRHRRGLLAELFPILHMAGTAPHNFTGRPGNASIVMIALWID